MSRYCDPADVSGLTAGEALEYALGGGDGLAVLFVLLSPALVLDSVVTIVYKLLDESA